MAVRLVKLSKSPLAALRGLARQVHPVQDRIWVNPFLQNSVPTLDELKSNIRVIGENLEALHPDKAAFLLRCAQHDSPQVSAAAYRLAKRACKAAATSVRLQESIATFQAVLSHPAARSAHKRKQAMIAASGAFGILTGAAVSQPLDSYLTNRAYFDPAACDRDDSARAKSLNLEISERVQQVEIEPSMARTDSTLYGTLTFGTLKVEARRIVAASSLNDKSPRTFKLGPVAANLTHATDEVLSPPALPAQFKRNVADQLESILKDDPSLRTQLQMGNVGALLAVTQKLTRNSFSAAPLEGVTETSSSGQSRIEVRGLGFLHLLRASAKQTPIDSFAAVHRSAVCDQMSDAYCYFLQAVQSLYPENFRNVYATSVSRGDLRHQLVLICSAAGSSSIKAFVWDPLNGNDPRIIEPSLHTDPTYTLLWTGLHRGYFSKASFYTAISQYCSNGGLLDDQDAVQLARLALSEDLPTQTLSLEAARQALRREHDVLPDQRYQQEFGDLSAQLNAVQ